MQPTYFVFLQFARRATLEIALLNPTVVFVNDRFLNIAKKEVPKH